MPTNANTFNSRVTSEALEAKFRQVFPSQGGAELPQDLFASGVIQPVIDFSSVAEGSGLQTDLQQAWDFATGSDLVSNAATTIINTTGFWRISGVVALNTASAGNVGADIAITDGLASKEVWRFVENNTTAGQNVGISYDIIVFVRSGDSVVVTSDNANVQITAQYRQIADVYGNLTNPLGFTFT